MWARRNRSKVRASNLRVTPSQMSLRDSCSLGSHASCVPGLFLGSHASCVRGLHCQLYRFLVATSEEITSFLRAGAQCDSHRGTPSSPKQSLGRVSPSQSVRYQGTEPAR